MDGNQKVIQELNPELFLDLIFKVAEKHCISPFLVRYGDSFEEFDADILQHEVLHKKGDIHVFYALEDVKNRGNENPKSWKKWVTTSNLGLSDMLGIQQLREQRGFTTKPEKIKYVEGRLLLQTMLDQKLGFSKTILDFLNQSKTPSLLEASQQVPELKDLTLTQLHNLNKQLQEEISNRKLDFLQKVRIDFEQSEIDWERGLYTQVSLSYPNGASCTYKLEGANNGGV